MNSVACGGKAGVSDTFASALWALDALFAVARSGADGVNLHMFPRARYGPAVTTVVKQRIDGFLQHAFFVPDDDVRRF